MERKDRFREAFLEEVQAPLSENVPLSALSSFGIGGPADLFFEARTESGLERAVSLAAREKNTI
jgi:UDP-N-acetylenolpyruvoylglucosamine reductase